MNIIGLQFCEFCQLFWLAVDELTNDLFKCLLHCRSVGVRILVFFSCVVLSHVLCLLLGVICLAIDSRLVLDFFS